MIFNNYRQLVRPVEAAKYWEIKPAPIATGKVVPMTAASPADTAPETGSVAAST